MAAQIDAQREPGAPSALSMDAVKITELRSRWIEITSPLRDCLRKPFAGVGRGLWGTRRENPCGGRSVRLTS